MNKHIPIPANGQSGKAYAHTPDGVNSAGPGAGEGCAYPNPTPMPKRKPAQVIPISLANNKALVPQWLRRDCQKRGAHG